MLDGSKPFRLLPPATRVGNTIVARNTVTDAMPSTRATAKSPQTFRLVPPPVPEHPTTQETIHQRAVTVHQKPIDEGEPVTRSSAAGSSHHHASTSQQFRLVPPPPPVQNKIQKSEARFTVTRPPTPEPFSMALPTTAALVLEQGTTQQRAANTGVDDKQKFTRSSAAGSSRHHATTMPSTSQSFRLEPPPAPVQDKKSAAHFIVARPPTPDPFSLELPPAPSRAAAQETIQQRTNDMGVANYQKPIDVKALRASAKKAVKAQRLRVEQKHQARANERYYFQHAEVDWETPLSRQELEETLTISLGKAVKKAGKTFRKATRLEIAQMVDIKLRSREQASAAQPGEFRRALPKVPASSKSTVPKVKPSPLLDALGFPVDILEMLALSKAVRPERFATLQTISAQRPIYEFRDRENGIEEPETVEQAMRRLVPALLPGDVSLVLEMMSIARAELFQLAMQHEDDEYGDDGIDGCADRQE